MLIALLVVLGVDLIVLEASAALVLGRRRWLKGHLGGKCPWTWPAIVATAVLDATLWERRRAAGSASAE